jgi:hypothetical protein
MKSEREDNMNNNLTRTVNAAFTDRQRAALGSLGMHTCYNYNINRLVRLEKFAHKKAEDICNFQTDEKWESRVEKHIERELIALFGHVPAGFHWNRDPRGYALKLDNEAVKLPEGIHTDWGGYGILAPID